MRKNVSHFSLQYEASTRYSFIFVLVSRAQIIITDTVYELRRLYIRFALFSFCFSSSAFGFESITFFSVKMSVQYFSSLQRNTFHQGMIFFSIFLNVSNSEGGEKCVVLVVGGDLIAR